MTTENEGFAPGGSNRRTAVMGITALLLAGACSDDPRTSVRVRVELGASPQCTATCDDAMGCGAVLGVRIIDGQTADAYADTCVELPPSESLCELDSLDVGTFVNIPTGLVQVQAVVWKPDADAFGSPPRCPSDTTFDLQGAPTLDNPGVALGGAVYFETGRELIATVPLSCVDAARLDGEECRPNTTAITGVGVDDLETALPVSMERARALDVSIAWPTEAEVTPGHFEWRIEPANMHELALDELSQVPRWNGTIPGTLGASACVLAIDKSEVVPATSAYCFDVPPGLAELTGVVSQVVSQAELDTFVGALGLTAMPPSGLVVGRVVDAIGNPVSGVVVEPAELGVSAEVRYVTEDRSGTSGLATTANGYFLSVNAPVHTAWSARAPDGRGESGTFRAGLVAGKVSVVRIQLAAN